EPTAPALPDGPSVPSTPDAVSVAARPEEDETPTDERSLLLDLLRRVGRPVHVRDLERQIPRREREQFESRGDVERSLERLVTTGDVVRTRKRTYGLPEAMNLVRGRFQATSGGFGFVIPEGGGDDYYIPPESTLEAWNGDTVLVRPEGRSDGGRRGGRESSPRATVVRIVQRHHSSLVGTLERSKGYAILKADDTRARHRILLVPDGTEDVPVGARVIARLFWPEHTGEDEVFGRVEKLLGETDDPETETQAVIFKYDLQAEFSGAALAEAEGVPARIPDDVIARRLDLRDEHVFTVDGRDAKDFDDAIHIRPAENGNFLVGVHIADVSHYVRPGTALDEDAYARATSVYLPGRVLPMLPERLSNGVCSLVPNEDRLTLSALVTVNADGDVQDVQVAESVIRSQARLTYDEVQAYSEGVATLPEHARKVEGDLHLLLKLTTRMRQKRLREGSLDFKLREVKVDVDKEGNLQLIPIREETARGMIEDLMLLANKVIARFLLERNVPALYRVHEDPTPGRFQEVSAALAKMGIGLGTEPTPQAYQAALKQVRGTPQETAVNTLLLRSLKQARYAEENLGHFGLAFEEYLHFTSPIRRYPDLIVHRAVRAVIEGRGQGREMEELRAALPKMGEHTSERERSAAEAERDLTKYYQAKWAQAHLGETFDGTVSGVTSFGLFVALENGVEGLLHISNLDDDYYFFIEDAQMLKGRSSGQTFRVGDPVTITIAQVNPIGRQIDFSQETDMTDNGRGPRARKRGEREQARAEERQPRMNERPARLAALDTQQPDQGGA
ncbi:ribonuclease R, partial [Deinococcus pimensis]|uniref:ribonuclease R n=1 Tax=Deinococcus pimensis TaxID=309888 RepID=UPI00146FB6DA